MEPPIKAPKSSLRTLPWKNFKCNTGWSIDMLETEDGSAKGIYFKMKEAFSNMNVPMSNING